MTCFLILCGGIRQMTIHVNKMNAYDLSPPNPSYRIKNRRQPMSKIKIIILVCFLLPLCGCFRNYDVYGFKTVEKNFEWGIVGAKLMGSESRKGNTIIKSSPYKLFLWFGSDTFMEGDISIEDIKLLNKRTGKHAFKGNALLESINKETGGYFANFLIENIKIPYENTELQIRFQLRQKNKSVKYKVSLLFKTDHQKFRRIIGV